MVDFDRNYTGVTFGPIISPILTKSVLHRVRQRSQTPSDVAAGHPRRRRDISVAYKYQFTKDAVDNYLGNM